MDEDTLKKVVEALLFAADEPLRTSRVADVIPGVDGHGVRRAIAALQEEYAQAGRGIQIEEAAGGFRMLSNRDYAEFVEQLQKRERKLRLSQAAFETLAIVAYRQPIHRAEIEAIRGVAVDSILRMLQERGLIRVVGRADILGHPFLYGTTRRFLETFGLNTLGDLPNVEEFQLP